MRLLDADKMIERLAVWNTSDKMDKAHYNFTRLRVMEQPTAYDVGKVCEQLERLRRIAFVTVANTSDEENDKIYSYLSKMVDDAIDIVKRGGINENLYTNNYRI